MFSSSNQTDHRYRDASSPVNTEPMNLGSPVSSPKNKANNQNYLPAYLFGETVISPIGTPTWNSPTPKQPNLSTFQSTSNLINPLTRFREQDTSYQSVSPGSIITTPHPAKSGGPPIQGLLYSTPNQSSTFSNSQLGNIQSATEKLGCEVNSFSGILTPSKSFCAANTSYISPAQIDPFFTQGEALKNSDQLDDSWVTVFGFPSASASYILQQFAQYGNIVEHKPSHIGNWMHLRYQSKLQAKKALSKNGKVFSGNIMIGVKPCIEMDLMETCRDNSIQETSILSNSLQTEILEASKPNLKNIRPLTQAYQSPNTQAQVTNPKSGGMVSKAFEYLWKLH